MNVGTWALELSGEPPATAFFIGPTRVDLGGAPEFALNATLSNTAGGLVIGGASGTRVELGPAVLTASLDVGAVADVSVGIAAPGSAVHISGGDGDSFLASILAAIAIDVPFDASLEWSLSGGLKLGGNAGLEVSIPAAFTIGPISVSGLTIGIATDDGVVALAARADLGAVVGPFAAAVEGLGLEAALDLDATTVANLGFGHLTIGFLPPSRIAFAIATDAVSGGGFVSIEPEIGRYSGGLSLDFVSVGIDAIVVIDTQLPGDPDGWAFFASLAASFPGIPLGFGFTLSGVGGLIALNRTMDAEALAMALRTGVIDALLFPDDPVNDSAELIAQIDEYFPLLEGNTVIGPVLEIGWGSPVTLITAQLGVVLSLPDGIIAVMGSVEALLPIPSAPLITLHMDSLGVIDIGAGTFSLTASLYDSRLLESHRPQWRHGDVPAGLRPALLLALGRWLPPGIRAAVDRAGGDARPAADAGSDLDRLQRVGLGRGLLRRDVELAAVRVGGLRHRLGGDLADHLHGQGVAHLRRAARVLAVQDRRRDVRRSRHLRRRQGADRRPAQPAAGRTQAVVRRRHRVVQVLRASRSTSSWRSDRPLPASRSRSPIRWPTSWPLWRCRRRGPRPPRSTDWPPVSPTRRRLQTTTRCGSVRTTSSPCASRSPRSIERWRSSVKRCRPQARTC